MIPMRLSEIAAVVDGEVHGGEVEVTGPAFVDSRLVEPGGLFVAVPGERVDGHDFAERAVAAGAAAVLGARPTGVPTVVVPDPVEALGRLARHVADRLDGVTLLALTGSQGKTGTKDLLAAVLATAGTTVATSGNFNNEIGVPLTVLRADAGTRYLIVEMGARGIGHIGYLCRIAPPSVAGVLNVGIAHLGEFGSRDGIARAKGEIVEALPDDGVAFLNADDPRVAAMADRTTARVLTFGAGPDADVRVEDLVLDDLGRSRFTLVHRDQREEVALHGLGAHQAMNAAAAAAAALGAGLALDDIATALSNSRAASHWRMELTERPDGVRVINDAYNANPDSMRAALETLAGIGRRTGARTLAVLGEMRELGDGAADEHRAIGRLVRELGIDELVVVGPEAAGIVEGAARREGDPEWGSPLHAGDVHEAAAWLRKTVRAPDVVLIKASRGAELERVASALLDDRADGEEPAR
jgi:UDP-N-acetylmuramoyl-tripeptide--D-alanyl-D-alanine ligase